MSVPHAAAPPLRRPRRKRPARDRARVPVNLAALDALASPSAWRWALGLGALASLALHAAFVAAGLLLGPALPLRDTIEVELVSQGPLQGLGQGVEDAPAPPAEPPPSADGPPVTVEPPPATVEPPPVAPRPKPRPKPPAPQAPQEEDDGFKALPPIDPKLLLPDPDEPKPPPDEPKPPPEEPAPPKEADAEGRKEPAAVEAAPPTEAAPPSKEPPPDPDAPRPAYEAEVPFEVRPVPEVKSVAPGNAIFTAVVDSRELRRSPHRASLEELVRALPDYLRVVGESGLEPLARYDKLLITSADLRYLGENLLVAQAAQPKHLKADLNAVTGEALGWEKRDGLSLARPRAPWWVEAGDERVFMLPAEGVVAFGKADYAPWLAAQGKKEEGFFPAMPAPLGEGGALPAVLVLEVSGIKLVMPPDAGGLPAPVALQVVVHDDARPLLRVRAVFASEAEAEDFSALWPDVQRRLGKALWLNLLGYGPMVARLQARKGEGPSAYLELRLTAQEMERLSKLGAQLILSKTAHLRPPPKATPSADAGLDAAQAPLPDAGYAGDAGSVGDARDGDAASKREEAGSAGPSDVGSAGDAGSAGSAGEAGSAADVPSEAGGAGQGASP